MNQPRQPTFSFLIPTRGRTDRLAQLFQSVVDTTARPDELEIVLGVDEDDLESQQVSHPILTIRKTILSPGLTMGRMNTACFEASSGRFVMLMNDDVILKTRNWDVTIRSVFDGFGDDVALVHVNDLLFKERLCTFPMLSRRACLAIGVCHAPYRRYRIDDHIYDIYNLLALLGHRRIVYVEDVVFEHHNYEEDDGQAHEQLFRSAEHSRVYVPNQAIIDEDAKRFDEAFAQRKKDALTLAGLIEGPVNQVRHETQRSTLAALTDSYSYRRPEFLIRHRNAPSAAPAVPATSAERSQTVTVAVVTADLTSPHATECIARLKRYTKNFNLTILDNNRSKSFNHPHEMNRAIRSATTDYLVLMDDDVYVEEGWLESLVACADEGTGVVAPMHRDRSGAISFSGVYLMGDGYGTHAHHLDVPTEPRRCQALCSAVMLIDLKKCGHVTVSEDYKKYFLDLDYSLRIWEACYDVVCTPGTTATHLAGATMPHGSSASQELWNRDMAIFIREWVDSGRLEAIASGIWLRDPFTAALAQLPRRIVETCRHSERWDDHAFEAEVERLIDETREFALIRSLLVTNLRECVEACKARQDNFKLRVCTSALHQLRDVAIVHSGPVPLLREAGATHNIVEFRGEFIGIPLALGHVDLTQPSHRNRPEFVVRSTFDAVKAAIDGPGHRATVSQDSLASSKAGTAAETPPVAAGAASNGLASRLRSDLAWELYHRSAYADAVASFEEAIALSKENARAWCGLGWAQLQLDRWRDARKAFDHVLASPRALEAHTAQEAYRGRAWCAYWEKRYTDAIQDFSCALESADPASDGPAIQDILLGRSRASYRAGLVDLAVQDGRRSQDPWGSSRSRLMISVYGGQLRRAVKGWGK